MSIPMEFLTYILVHNLLIVFQFMCIAYNSPIFFILDILYSTIRSTINFMVGALITPSNEFETKNILASSIVLFFSILTQFEHFSLKLVDLYGRLRYTDIISFEDIAEFITCLQMFNIMIFMISSLLDYTKILKDNYSRFISGNTITDFVEIFLYMLVVLSALIDAIVDPGKEWFFAHFGFTAALLITLMFWQDLEKYICQRMPHITRNENEYGSENETIFNDSDCSDATTLNDSVETPGHETSNKDTDDEDNYKAHKKYKNLDPETVEEYAHYDQALSTDYYDTEEELGRCDTEDELGLNVMQNVPDIHINSSEENGETEEGNSTDELTNILVEYLFNGMN